MYKTKTASQVAEENERMFNELLRHYGAEPDSRGWVHVICPMCGREPDENRPNFSFHLDRGGHCFHGCPNISIFALYRSEIGTNKVADCAPRAPRKEKVVVDAPWKRNAITLLSGYTSHPNRVAMWRKYKPVSEENVIRYRLGYGVLPGRSDWRLILPDFDENGNVVALHGRTLSKETEVNGRRVLKWDTALGSRKLLYGLHEIRPKSTVILGENYLDRLLVLQASGGTYSTLAAGGARRLNDIEIAAIVSAKPREVVVAYDNDLTGQASGAMYRMLLDRWRNEIKERTGLFPKKDREPVGPLVANQLNAAGVKAYLMPWPKHAPEAADLGWLFAQS